LIDETVLRAQLSRTLLRTELPLGRREEGKVRDCYIADGRRTLIATDRISAFDVVLGTIPFKGQVLNQLAAHWFRETAAIAPNHLVATPDPNVTVAIECRPLPVEMVMRGYLTGVTSTSIWTAYERGERTFCGHRLPDGMRKHQRLPEPLLTPSTKAAKGEHDRSISRDETIGNGLLTAPEFDTLAEMCARLFRHGSEQVRRRGLILVDTKYEFGRAPDNKIVLMDEIHTPDSSRYWYADAYEEAFGKGCDPRALDKEYVRRWLADRGYRGDGPPPELPDDVRLEAARRYIEAFERVTGTTFVADTTDPQARIRRNLGLP
jgi:phosphoribosylaminoimidazole-succinocarboxamide synthase